MRGDMLLFRTALRLAGGQIIRMKIAYKYGRPEMKTVFHMSSLRLYSAQKSRHFSDPRYKGLGTHKSRVRVQRRLSARLQVQKCRPRQPGDSLCRQDRCLRLPGFRREASGQVCSALWAGERSPGFCAGNTGVPAIRLLENHHTGLRSCGYAAGKPSATSASALSAASLSVSTGQPGTFPLVMTRMSGPP